MDKEYKRFRVLLSVQFSSGHFPNYDVSNFAGVVHFDTVKMLKSIEMNLIWKACLLSRQIRKPLVTLVFGMEFDDRSSL